MAQSTRPSSQPQWDNVNSNYQFPNPFSLHLKYYKHSNKSKIKSIITTKFTELASGIAVISGEQGLNSEIQRR